MGLRSAAPSKANAMSVAGAALLVSIVAGCATAPPQPPAPLEFSGTLDLSRPGIGFRLEHTSGLTCEGHHSGSSLPETFIVPLRCNDQKDGLLDAVKQDAIRATIKLADGRTGVSTIPLPAKPIAAMPARTVYAAPRSSRRGYGSRGGPGYRLPNGKCASWRR